MGIDEYFWCTSDSAFPYRIHIGLLRRGCDTNSNGVNAGVRMGGDGRCDRNEFRYFVDVLRWEFQ